MTLLPRPSVSFGTGEEPCLLKYYIAKGKELNNPMDPTSGETGMLLYVMVGRERKTCVCRGGREKKNTFQTCAKLC